VLWQHETGTPEKRVPARVGGCRPHGWYANAWAFGERDGGKVPMDPAARAQGRVVQDVAVLGMVLRGAALVVYALINQNVLYL
jgi:hypothetical protein